MSGRVVLRWWLGLNHNIGPGSSTSLEVQNHRLRWALAPAQAKGDGEERMERLPKLDQSQEEEVRKKDSAKRTWVQKREAGPIPIELKAQRNQRSFLSNTFIQAFPER